MFIRQAFSSSKRIKDLIYMEIIYIVNYFHQ